MSDTPVDTARMVSLQDAAAQLHVSDKTIRRWISGGHLRAERVGPRLIRVDLDSLHRETIGGAAA